MKRYLFILTIFLVLFLIPNCQKSSDLVSPLDWGEESHGLIISVSPGVIEVSEQDSCELQLTIKNIAGKSLHYQMLASLNLYNADSLWCYMTFMDLMLKDMGEIETSSWLHPQTDFTLEAGETLEYMLDVRKLGWASPIDSHFPLLDFFQKVEKKPYTLLAELYLKADEIVVSNQVKLLVK